MLITRSQWSNSYLRGCCRQERDDKAAIDRVPHESISARLEHQQFVSTGVALGELIKPLLQVGR
jgi:hypothetical protein